MNVHQFKEMGRERGFIGLPAPDFLDDLSGLEIELAGPKGDVLARLYWWDGTQGGCISIPSDHLLLEEMRITRRRIEDRLRKDWKFLKKVAELM